MNWKDFDTIESVLELCDSDPNQSRQLVHWGWKMLTYIKAMQREWDERGKAVCTLAQIESMLADAERRGVYLDLDKKQIHDWARNWR